MKPRRADDATRMTRVALSRFVEWRRLLTIVKPATLIRWHRKGFPVVLALEIEETGPTSDSGPSAARDRDDGGRESDVG